MRKHNGAPILADYPNAPITRASDLMIESMRLRNFKCFEETDIDDLGRVNVVVGDNGSGKTALLEAVYLLCGNTAENHLKMGQWRGLRGSSMMATSENDVESGELWRDLFFLFDLDKRIVLDLKGSVDRNLVIARENVVPGVAVGGGKVRAPITFAWRGGKSAKAVRTIPELNLQDRRIEFPPVAKGIDGAHLTASVSASEVAERFSKLDKLNRAGSVTSAITSEFNDIEGLSIQTDPTVGHMLYASLASLRIKVPLAYVSAGINRLLYILVTVASYPQGAVTIDEIDNGIFHKRLPSLWRAVNGLSKEYHTQVFASTHSSECLSALHDVLMEDEKDFRLIKVTRDPEGRSHTKVYAGRNLSAAIEGHVEVR